MKAAMKKVSNVLKTIFGYGIMISLFAGGLTFFGYVAALIIGGETATAICAFIYKTITPIIVYLSTSMVLLGLVAMYLAGEMALTSQKKPKAKKAEAASSDAAECIEAAESGNTDEVISTEDADKPVDSEDSSDS